MANAFNIRKALKIGETIEISSILDEDTMSSNSATALATQQSIKAYVDNASTIVAAGNTGEIQFNNADAFAADSNLFWDNTNKRLGIGTSTPEYPLEVSGADATLGVSRYATAGAQPTLYLRKANGTEGSPATVINGDALGAIVIRNYTPDGSWQTSAGIIAQVEGTPSATNVPTSWKITTNDFTSTATRLYISPAGKLATGGATPDVTAGGITLSQGIADGAILTFKSSDVTHPFTSLAATDTYVTFTKSQGLQGGLQISGFSDTVGANGVRIRGFGITPNTDDTHGGLVALGGYKYDGSTGSTTLADAENLVSIENGTLTGIKVVIKGNGDIVSQAGISISDTSRAVDGTIKYVNNTFSFRQNGAWATLDTPGGSDGFVQFNSGGFLGGVAEFSWDNTNKKLNIGNTSSDTTSGGITLYQGSLDGTILAFKSSNSSQPFTSYASTETYGIFAKLNGTRCGLLISGFSDFPGAPSMGLRGFSYSATTEDTNKGVVTLIGYKSDQSTGATTLTNTENLVSVENGTVTKLMIKGSGDIVTQGGISISDSVRTADGTIKYVSNAFSFRQNGAWVGLGSGGTPGGSDGQVQYNNSSAFGGASDLYYNDVLKTVAISDYSNNTAYNVDGSTHNYKLVVSGQAAGAYRPSIFVDTVADGSFLFLSRANGTTTTKTTVADGDRLGSFWFEGYDGTKYVSSAGFSAIVDGTVATGAVPTALQFRVRDAIGVLNEGLRITPDRIISTGGETAPDAAAGGLCLNQGAADGSILTFKSSDISHPFTTYSEADTYGAFAKSSATGGGLLISGYRASGAVGLNLSGYSQAPGTGATGAGALFLIGYKTNGTTGVTDIAATEALLTVRNNLSVKVNLMGSGDIITQAGVSLSDSTMTTDGTIKYVSNAFSFRQNGSWVGLGSGGTPGGSDSFVQFNSSNTFGGVAEFVWDNTNKRLGIGTSSPDYNIEVSNTGNSIVAITRYSDANGQPGIHFRKAGGTEGSPTNVASGHYTGSLSFMPRVGGSFTWSAGIRCYVEGVPTITAPSRMEFLTADSSSTQIRFIINSDGKLSTGGETTPDVDTGGICINHGTGDGFPLTFKNSDVSHPFTSLAEADTYFRVNKSVNTAGGANLIALSGAGGNGIGLLLGGASLVTLTGDNEFAALILNGYKSDGGTSIASHGANENVVAVRSGSSATTLAVFKGDGTLVNQGGIAIGDTTRTTDGTIKYVSNAFSFRQNGSWVNLAAGTPGGSDTQIQFNDGGSFGADSTLTFNKTKEYLKVGTNPSTLQNAGTTYTHGLMLSHAASGTDLGGFGIETVGGIARTHFYRASGTLGALAAVADTDVIGGINMYGHDGTEYEIGVAIQAVVDGTPSSNVMPVGMRFMTRESSTLSTKLVITKDGKIATGGETAPDVEAGGITVGTDITSYGKYFTLKNSNVTHGFTDLAEADTVFYIGDSSNGSGGVNLFGFNSGSSGSVAVNIGGLKQNIATGDTSMGCVNFNAYTSNGGTGIAAIADAGNLVSFRNYQNIKTVIKGNGNIISQGNSLVIATSKTPSSATDTGQTGQMCWDASYVYVCTATNTWKRTAITTW